MYVNFRLQLYLVRCVHFEIMSSQLNVPQVDKDDELKQDAPEVNFESHSKGSEYLIKFVFLNVYKAVLTLSLWGIVCRLMRTFLLFNLF